MSHRILLCLVACSSPVTHDDHVSALAPNPRFEIRIAETQLGANGHTKHEVLVVGTRPDGTSSSDKVVLGLDRPNAGTFTKTTLDLGPHGATTYFVPCNQASAGCTGAAMLTVARAADPATVVAAVAVELATPAHISTVAPCRGAEKIVMDIDGQNGDFIRNGMLRVIEWGSVFAESSTDKTSVRLSLSPRRGTQGNNWSMQIDSLQLGAPLAPGVYKDAMRSGFASSGRPGLSVGGNAHGCNTVAGAFEIHELNITATGVVNKVLVSFEQHCDADTTKRLEGCFRYEKP